jgi:type IV pilus assembly protein PilM
LLGLDVSASSVKLVELGRDASGTLVLERCAIEPLERGWVIDGHVEKFDEVARAVRRTVRKSRARTRNVALALPASAVMTRKITLPGDMNEQELGLQVESEASQYLPFSLDEVSLDFCVLGPSGQSEPGAAQAGEVEVLIAASRKDKVQDRQGLAEAAGLKAVVLDVESHAARLAISHWVGHWIGQRPGRSRDAVVALFEVGAVATRMQVLRDQEVLYDRDQSFGGAQLTQHIARRYGFTEEEAELRKRGGDLPENFGPDVLQPFVAGMAQDIARALQFFFNSTPHHRVDGVLLAGGSGALPGLSDAVTRQTSFVCSLVNPFDGMAIGRGVREKRMRREATSYLTACGLAMRRFWQ